MTGFDFIKHFLKTRAVIGHTAVAVINEKCRVGEAVISCVLKQHGLLILDGVRQIFFAVFLLILGVLYGQSAIECCDFVGCLNIFLSFSGWATVCTGLEVVFISREMSLFIRHPP